MQPENIQGLDLNRSPCERIQRVVFLGVFGFRDKPLLVMPKFKSADAFRKRA
jgi:hypothetical protein